MSGLVWRALTVAAEIARRHELRAFHRRQAVHTARFPGR